MPPWKMEELMQTLNAMPNDDKNKTILKRIIGSESVQVTPDKAGRICLPEEMARAAGIQDEAVLAGLLDRFEIWSPERYAKIRATDQAMAPDAFRMME
jgi:MraZ protein